MDKIIRLTGQSVGNVVVLRGVGPDAPVEENEQGGRQAGSPYRFDLIPARALAEVAAVLKEGADTHGEWNWLQIPLEAHLNRNITHAYAHLGGDRQEGPIGHLARNACRALFALEVALRELDKADGHQV